jgi:thiamine-monophosphate kinase
MPLTEFDIIQRYFTRKTTPDPALILGIGDDAAILHVPEGMELAVSMDTLVEGVHFPAATHPADIGYKALAVSLSDMAAMGAEPRWAMLALTLPVSDEPWLESFSKGFFNLAERYGVQLIGGDTTRGPLAITVQIHGLVPAGTALRRSAARSGNLIYVTGEVGDAGLALLLLQEKISLSAEQAACVMTRLNRPEPRVKEGLALRGIAHAAIDLSDGLVADLGHILKASEVGATLYMERLPLSPAVTSVLDKADGWNLPLNAGDDYELCFTVPRENQTKLQKAIQQFPCRCTCIGMIEETLGLRCQLVNGELFEPIRTGYQHFV